MELSVQILIKLIYYQKDNMHTIKKINPKRYLFAVLLFLTAHGSFAQITIGTNFQVRAGLPIDSRMVVASLAARDAINTLYRYEGLSVYVVSNQTNYQLIGGTANANWQATSSGSFYAAGTGLTLSGGTFSHGNHTGDVSGSTTLTVIALQGRSIDATIPTSGNVLGWNGSAWAPVADNNTVYSSGTGLTLSGNTFFADNTSAIWNANQLNGTSISTNAPAANEILKWNGTEWAPAADNNTTYDAGTGITLTGNTFSADNTSPIWNANQLNGTSISTNAPAGNEVLKWNGTEWAPAADNNTTYDAGTGIILTGNTFSADNTTPIWNAGQIMGFNINTTAPFPTQVLKWNGTDWAPASDNNTSYDAGTGIILTGNTFSADNTSPIWNANQLNGTTISTNAPAANEILKWNGTEWAPANDNNTTYDAGTGIILTGNTFSADNTSPIWNANQLNGTSISTNAPAANEILKWNGTEWAPAADNNTSYDAGTGITLTGNTFSADNTSAIWNANQLNGTSISTNAPASNDILKWNGSEWVPSTDNNTTYDAGTGLTLTGNTFLANNTTAIWNANQLNGTAISTTAPASNEVLKWNGSEWAPATDNNTLYAAGTGITLSANTFSADNTSPIWNANQLNGSTISTTAPVSNEVLKWNGTEWTPATDNNTLYAAGTGITLSANTFSADNTSPIWNANQLNGSTISTTTPGSNEVLKWNGSEWAPAVDDNTTYSAGSGISLSGTTISLSGPVDVNMGGTGQTTYTNGQLLIGNASGSLTKSTLTSGTGISITNGDGSITITNSDPNQNHTGDATGATAITVVGLQGRSIATTIPTNGNVLSWNSTSSSWVPSASSSYNGNRVVKRAAWPTSINMGTTTNISDFLDAVFFPFLSATISINANVLYEIGTTNSVTISGTTTARDETVFSNGRVDEVYPATTTIYSFGANTTYSTSITFTPDKSVTSSLELRYVAYQGVANNGTPTTINSTTKLVQSCYPFLHGVSSDNLTSGGTFNYSTLSSNKLIATKSDKTVSLTGSGYIYFCFPASYGTLTAIFDQNGYAVFGSFTLFTANVTSIGLTNNWTESYNIYQSNTQTTPSAWNYQFKF
jgi:hypothetical protein